MYENVYATQTLIFANICILYIFVFPFISKHFVHSWNHNSSQTRINKPIQQRIKRKFNGIFINEPVGLCLNQRLFESCCIYSFANTFVCVRSIHTSARNNISNIRTLSRSQSSSSSSSSFLFSFLSVFHRRVLDSGLSPLSKVPPHDSVQL